MYSPYLDLDLLPRKSLGDDLTTHRIGREKNGGKFKRDTVRISFDDQTFEANAKINFFLPRTVGMFVVLLVDSRSVSDSRKAC